MEKIWLSSPHMGEMERTFMLDAFDSNWIAPLGPYVNRLENDLSTVLGGSIHVAALSSGTAALHLALVLLGIQPGDVVICQSMTFSASANPIVYMGATPLFVDSETDTWNICPQLLEKAIIESLKKGTKPKAIIVVHLYGMPAKMKELMEIASNYDIPIIEDAAEALGSSYNGIACGNFGQIGILSFNGNKIITTSGGGALLSVDPKIVERARFLSTQARESAPHYEHEVIGYNYRLSNICAAIGCGQLIELENRVAKRRHNFDLYYKVLSGIPGVQFLHELNDAFSNRWLTTILIDHVNFPLKSALECMEYLQGYNIESRPLWKPMHLQPVFKDAPSVLNGVSESLFKTGLCLPSGSNLSEDQVIWIANLLNNYLVK
jgi:dTDP-4-amino-4,6-dideoxygalactose transaminase